MMMMMRAKTKGGKEGGNMDMDMDEDVGGKEKGLAE